MKNEKLELLLNKVVEYNNPEKSHFKGFLYRSGGSYYIKVVETISGTDIAYNDVLYLNDGEDQYIIVADKPKLMRVSMKSWHYKLLQFVLRSKAPTPQTMQNGCPYYWLVVFSLLVVVFVAIARSLVAVFFTIPKLFFKLIEVSVNKWIAKLPDERAYEYYNWWGGSYTYSLIGKPPVNARVFFNQDDDDFFTYFLKTKYGYEKGYEPEANERKEQIKERWKIWRAELEAKRDAERQQRYKEHQIRLAKEEEKKRKAEERREEWEKRLAPVQSAFNSLFSAIRKAFTFSNTKNIIKRTKQFVGFVITVILIAASYFVVQGLALGLMWVIDLIINGWMVIASIGALIVLAIIGYGLYIYVGGWIQGKIDEYDRGKKVWYISASIYGIWYPIKYISLLVGYGVFYIVITPVWWFLNNILFPVGKWVGKTTWKGMKWLWKTFTSSTGIFGEYFNASYTDYCPGIEWTDTDTE